MADQIGAVSLSQGSVTKINWIKAAHWDVENQDTWSWERKIASWTCAKFVRIFTSRSNRKGKDSSRV